MTALKTRLVPIGDLVPDPENARKHDARNLDAIQRSLATFGQRKPIVCARGNDGQLVVIAGNGTLEAAKALGWTDIAVAEVPADWDADKARAYAIADNRTAELAEWDDVALSSALVELDAVGWDLKDLGFEPVQPPQNPDDEHSLTEDDLFDEVPEPITKPGDLWLLDGHRVLCGDSFDDADLRRLLDGNRVQVVATDPPYAIYGSSTGIGSDVADDKMVRPFFESLFRIAASCLPTFGHAYFCTDWRSWSAMWEAAKRSGLAPKNMLIWDKGSGGMGAMYQQCHELVGFFAKAPQSRVSMSSQEAGERVVYGKPNILRFSRVAGAEREHNAAKPVGLMEELIANSSDVDGIVLDLFGGSGSTLIASENLGRRCFVMEMEPKYVDVIVARWERKTGRQAQRVREG